MPTTTGPTVIGSCSQRPDRLQRMPRALRKHSAAPAPLSLSLHLSLTYTHTLPSLPLARPLKDPLSLQHGQPTCRVPPLLAKGAIGFRALAQCGVGLPAKRAEPKRFGHAGV